MQLMQLPGNTINPNNKSILCYITHEPRGTLCVPSLLSDAIVVLCYGIAAL